MFIYIYKEREREREREREGEEVRVTRLQRTHPTYSEINLQGNNMIDIQSYILISKFYQEQSNRM